MAFFESSKLAESDKFQRQVLIALLTACRNVVAEDAQTLDHAKRAAYASNVISNPTQYLSSASMLVATNPAIDSTLSKNTGAYETTASDSDVQFTVNSYF